MGFREGLASSIGNLGRRLVNVGMAEAPAVEKAVASVAEKSVGTAAKRGLSDMSKAMLQEAVPNAVLTAGFNLVGGASPLTALAAGAIDLGMNYGGMQLAHQYSPGHLGKLSYTDPKTGNVVEHNQLIPSRMQRGVQMVAPIASSMAIMPLLQAQDQQQPESMDQTTSTDQQLLQRQYINNLGPQLVSPGTNFQLAGLQSTMSPTIDSLDLMAASRWP
jgi:hypothetical protein